jgi:hypothetical protein
MRASIFLLAVAALAQQAPPDPVIVMGGLENQMAPLAGAWLHNVDPRLRAWGAYVVLRDRRTEAIPDLLAMVAGFPVVEEVATQTDVDQHDAMLGVLDALIQLGAQVPAGDAQRLYPEFPVQSLILLTRSQEDTTPAFLQIFKSERRWPAAWLVAGALLVERRAEGFPQAVVEGMTVHALVMVTEAGSGSRLGGGSMCCLGGGLPRLKNEWPPVGVYAFDSCGESLHSGAMVLAGGTDPAYYSRQVTATYQSAGGSGCGCNPDQDLVREHYLTEMLSDSSERPPVRAHVSHTIAWQDLNTYRSELVNFIGDQKHMFAELARRLGENGLVSATDAKSIRPKLDIRVWDQRATRVPALTLDAALEENITIERF